MKKQKNIEEIKVILVGNSGAGKTSLINVSIGEHLNLNEQASLRASYVVKDIKIYDETYKICLWDTMGQERFRSVTKIFVKDSNIVILTYDITNKKSFEDLDFWYNTVEEILGQDAIYAVVGNKSDLFVKEKVKEEQVKKYTESKNMKYKLTTAKNPLTFNSFLEELVMLYISKGVKKKGTRNKKLTKTKGDKVNDGKCCK